MLRAVAEQYRRQQAIATTTTATLGKLWRRMSDDFDTSWSRLRPQALELVNDGRSAAVTTALLYTPAVLAETNQRDDPTGALDGSRFLVTTPDGRGVDTLLDEAVIKAKVGVGRGLSAEEGLAIGGRFLTMASLTLLADTRREVFSADIIQRPSVTGYVRMLNPPSCNRCVILAGKWFRWNEGFQRHPKCDCQHIPGAENVVGDERTDPYELFRSLSPAEQERIFGRSEARAIREGADIYRVVNVSNPKRGLASAAVARRYGAPSRFTVDDIYRNAGTRTRAIQMLRDEGYILDRGQVAISRSPGVLTDAQVIALGRGRGTYTLGGERLTTNRAARYDAALIGRRDPLRRSTMTAGERRLYDAHYRLAYAQRNGVVPRSIGRSSADLYANAIPATPARIAELRGALQAELGILSASSSRGTKALAEALGIRITEKGATTPLLSGAGAGGIQPPRRGGPPLPPPDPDDRPAWEEHWRRRQEALALDTGGDVLEPREVEFLERFLVSNQVSWIPRDRERRLPTNDFVWDSNGALVMELKSTSAKYQSIRNHIHSTVLRAQARGVVKENFIIDIGAVVLTDKLRRQLSEFNTRTTSTPIRRLFIMSADGLEEIRLR
ncbi:hypothetical protein [Microbacterium maritypicum]